jgi:alkylation response protein AidB-like acyl-CoA dehydrogenase
MGHYKSNLRDLEFVLFEVLRVQERMGTGPYAEMDQQTAHDLLREIDRLARGPLADSFAEADRNPPVFDPATHTVELPAAFKKAYRALRDGEWYRLDLPAELGGFGAPSTLRWAASELLLGAHAAVFMYLAGPSMACVVHANGTAEQQRWARFVIEKGWSSTMALTEADAGSDVGAGRTRAIAQPDGSWHIEGVKRFITSAEHDLTDNIMHLVLARPEGPGITVAQGTKGLSLFLVPKYHFDTGTGELGERNGVFVTGLEHKMGLKASATCELTFGAHGTPAVGWLLGDVHNGIAQMFQVIEYARMMVGTKAIATLSSGYLNALEYARQRVQGPDITQMRDKSAPRVTIIHHPDVRRMLMLQKAYAEGLRALYLYAASYQDAVELGGWDSSAAGSTDLATRVNGLLLPIVKGVGSERASEMLTLSLQTLGGSGFLQDYPIEQYIRDAKIDSLYEGTTAIQSLDFFFRKIIRDRGVAIGHLNSEIQAFLAAGSGSSRLKEERALLATALDDFQAMLGFMINSAVRAGEDPRNTYKVGQQSVRLLMSTGDLLIGWLLLRQAEVALAALDGPFSPQDEKFYQGKIAAATFFAHNILPELTARRTIVESTDNTLMDVPEMAF